jgi:adenosylcobinamide-phosphate synthase
LISITDKVFRKVFPQTDRGKFIAGLSMTIVVSIVAFFVPYLLLVSANIIDPLVAFILESILCFFAFSTKSLKVETMKIYKLLSSGEVEKSKEALSMIVGRDTENLSEEGIIKAAVETISENTTDGVIAPMLFMIIGGAPFAYFYKAVNTMDSMVGYKNDKYLFFGRYAAKLDDTLNYIPARIAANIMIFAAYIMRKFDGKNARRIYIRDRFKHASPNSGHTEAVCAGALRIQLAGDAYYFGVKHKKEYIGDTLEKVIPDKILMANKLLYATAGVSLLLFSILKFILISVISQGIVKPLK